MNVSCMFFIRDKCQQISISISVGIFNQLTFFTLQKKPKSSFFCVLVCVELECWLVKEITLTKTNHESRYLWISWTDFHLISKLDITCHIIISKIEVFNSSVYNGMHRLNPSYGVSIYSSHLIYFFIRNTATATTITTKHSNTNKKCFLFYGLDYCNFPAESF